MRGLQSGGGAGGQGVGPVAAGRGMQGALRLLREQSQTFGASAGTSW